MFMVFFGIASYNLFIFICYIMLSYNIEFNGPFNYSLACVKKLGQNLSELKEGSTSEMMRTSKVFATALAVLSSNGLGYKLDAKGQCEAEDGDSPPRRVAGLVAPNATALNGASRSDAGGGDGSACGCDPHVLPPYTYQLNRKCPLNAEPLLRNLRSAGFITPVDVSLKRNHGPIPLLGNPEDFRVTINGFMLKEALELTLNDIKQFRVHTVQTVMACAGNRRTEMNLNYCPAPPTDAPAGNSYLIDLSPDQKRYKRVDGVAWGAAALGNNEFTGAYLSDILLWYLAEIDFDRAAVYVEMEGADICSEETDQGVLKTSAPFCPPASVS